MNRIPKNDFSEFTHDAAPRRHLPWDKPCAPEYHKGMTKQQRKECYDSRRLENITSADDPAVKAYNDLFQRSSIRVEDRLDIVFAYADTRLTNKLCEAKLLCAIVYAHQALSVGSTTFTNDPTLSLLHTNEPQKVMFRVAASLSYHKLLKLGFSLENYFAPNTVASMKGFLNL